MHVSPLGRARETAAILRSHLACREVIMEPRIQEITLGAWDGLDRTEIDAKWPNALARATSRDWFFHSPDGESYTHAMDRVSSWLREQNTTIIAVSHGLTGKLLRGAYLGLDRAQTLELRGPQGVVFRLAGGRAEALTLAAPAVEHQAQVAGAASRSWRLTHDP